MSVTKEDLQQFKHELLRELKTILPTTPPLPKRWLRSYEVRNMLNISPGTLQSLRLKKILHPKKIGTLLFFDHEEITELLNTKSQHPQNQSK